MRGLPEETGLLFSRKDLTRLMLPLIIEQFLAVMVGMADSAMVSSAGQAAMSGVSLVDMLNVLLINLMAAARHRRCGCDCPDAGRAGPGRRA